MKDTTTSFLVKFSGLAMAWLGPFLGPITSFLTITFFLVFSDLITGIWSAKKRGEKIHSRGMRRSITKIIAYFFAIILSRGMEVVFFEETWIQDHIPITYLVSGFISAIEFQSNIENIGEITGIDIWSQLKKKISTLLKINQDAE